MEYLEGDANEDYRSKVSKLMQSFEDQIDKLKNPDVVDDIKEELEDEESFALVIGRIEKLMVKNLPACAVILEEKLQNEELSLVEHLDLIHLMVQVTMSLESFTRAHRLAEEAYVKAKSLYEKCRDGKQRASCKDGESKDSYRVFVQAAFDCFYVCRYEGLLQDAKIYLDELQAASEENDNVEDQHRARIFYADWLLAKGLLNKAIDEVLHPLLKFDNLSKKNEGMLLQKLGNACRSAALWGPAKEHLRKSIKIAQKMKDKIAEYDRTTDLGNVYRSEGRIEDALKHQFQHLHFAFQRGDFHGLTIACFNIGFAYYSISPDPDLVKALVFLVVQHDLATQMDNRVLQGIALNNIGKAFCALGLHMNAIPVFEKCLSIAKRTGNKGGEGMAYGNLGTAYRALGRLDEAVTNHTNYLENARERGDTGGMAIMQRELAWDYLFKGELNDAKEQVMDSISTSEEIRRTLGTEDSSRLANFDKNQSEAYNILQVCLAKMNQPGKCLALSEFARARAITDLVQDRHIQHSLIEQKTIAWNDRDKERIEEHLSKQILEEFTSLSESLQTTFLVYSIIKEYNLSGTTDKWLYIWLFVSPIHLKKEHNGKLVHLRKVKLSEHMNRAKLLDDAAFFTSLSRSFNAENVKDFKDGNNVEPAAPDATGDDESYDHLLFSIRNIPNRESVNELVELLASLNLIDNERLSGSDEPKDVSDTSKLQPLLGEHCQATINRDISKDQQERAQPTLGLKKDDSQEQLKVWYDICIAPVEDILPEKQDGALPRLTIIPHEFLFNIPFCALQDENEKYLIEKFVICYTPSLRVFQLLHSQLAQRRENQRFDDLKVLAVGNPTMLGSDFKPLEHAGEELQLLKEIFKDVAECVIASEDRATKSLVLSSLEDKDIIHIASHAVPSDPEENLLAKSGDYLMRGCIVLAPSDRKCNGLLLAREIAKKSCRCQLITLSCCETGLGKLSGDGVLGLSRALLSAGATGLIVTLWKISDQFAPVFMKMFYEAFLKYEEDVAMALHEAMVLCIKEKVHPRQWGAFSFIGATKPRVS